MKLSVIVCTVALILPLVAFAQGPAPADPIYSVHAASGLTTYTPMTREQRFHNFIHGTFSVEAAARAAAGAAILQGMDTPREWGQGGLAYGQRFANDYAQHIVRQSLLYSVSDLLNEDNRYFSSGLSATGPRVKYAIESTFLARKPDGHRKLSYSRLTSVVATAFISREWQPRSTAGAEHAGLSVAAVLGTEIGFNVAREFLPKLLHTR